MSRAVPDYQRLCLGMRRVSIDALFAPAIMVGDISAGRSVNCESVKGIIICISQDLPSPILAFLPATSTHVPRRGLCLCLQVRPTTAGR